MKKLKLFLTINGLFSLLSGVLMMTFQLELNEFFELNFPNLFSFIGASLILFAGLVGLVVIKYLHKRMLVYLISTLDFLWVVLSFAIILLEPINLSPSGIFSIGLVAIWVGFLGGMQFIYNRG